MQACVIVLSDKCASGQRVDESGVYLVDKLKENGFISVDYIILPDEKEQLEKALLDMVKANKNLILTTGGTGLSKRDITPDVTKGIIDREVVGIPEAIRVESYKYTKRAMLTRGVAGVKDNTLIINLPGSRKAVEEAFDIIIDAVLHGLKSLKGEVDSCGRK